MSNEKTRVSWEYKGCREELKDGPHPGRRACHITCNTCIQPENGLDCNECELGPCRLALQHLRKTRLKRGQYFEGQLTGEETLYHALQFVNGQQRIINQVGEKEYVKELKKENGNLERDS